MNRRLSDNVKHIGPFSLRWREGSSLLHIRHATGEGGYFQKRSFTREVGPWDEIGAGDEEKIQVFYSRHF